MPRNGDATRKRILQAANRLFYGAGVRAVGVDAVAEKAGVTKKTLYYHFRSKDDLVEAYLASRDQPNLALFAKWFDEAEGAFPDRIRALFANLAASTRGRRWKGCGFLRTAAELVDTPGHPAVKLAGLHKKKLEAWLAGIIAVDGRAQAEELARQIVLLMDGSFSAMLVHRDAAYIESAGDAAVALLERAGERRPAG
ncbi:TetR/AcrR family transcriptional regulator [Aquamicrobium sp. LC103]|uniref:TetR/AcrR family transcriptional regulator n=1 Tax=Aquamicrobium sp. LC103 TaxID=1120658 RepID=UPI00063EA7AB|nr:TetR/AcrR family transcriptional regulator [Aquamicrobium sp. LC103]TKT74912.1 TetR/AcrR family transcriptional regulator [Aquamicrobium sp. LC103]